LESHPKVVGLMYVMLLLGMIASAMVFGMALADFSPGRLVQVIQASALAALVLNGCAMWKQEVRRPPRGRVQSAPEPSFSESWALFCRGDHTIRRLVIVGLGTLGFGLADVLLEPFGGQVLNLEVASTTRLTALFAAGGLAGFGYASHALNRGGDAYRVSQAGAILGVPGFVLILSASPLSAMWPFLLGNFLLGFGGALFGHGTLTVTMDRAPKEQAGLALGAWGAVQATAAGAAMGLSGVMRDVVNVSFASGAGSETAPGYHAVYGVEIVLLLITIWAIVPLLGRASAGRARLSAGSSVDSAEPQPAAVETGRIPL